MTVATADAHTLAVGKTRAEQAIELDDRIAMLGFTDVIMQPRLDQLFMILAGRSGEGKSALLQSCPGAYIINSDISSTTTSGRPRARMWPGINPDTGQPVEPSLEAPGDPRRGNPFRMSWAKILERKETLIQLATENVIGRPRLVALDTVDMSVDLIMQDMIANEGKASWEDLYGPSAWPKLYKAVVDFATDLRRVGYGVILSLHLGDRTLHLQGNSKEYLRDVPLITDNFFNQIRRFAEIVACVEMENKQVPIMVTKNSPDGKPLLDANKKPIKVPSGKTTPRSEVYLSFVSEKMNNVAKKRAGLPDRIFLPKDNPWGAFEDAYNKAIGVDVKPAA